MVCSGFAMRFYVRGRRCGGDRVGYFQTIFEQ